MDILQKSVNVLSKKEIVNYKLYTNRIKFSTNRKDLELFDSLKNNLKSDLNKDIIFNKLYGNSANKNTYNKLKSRLLTEIDNSLVQFYFHETDATYIYSELSLYKIYLGKNEWDVAYYHLHKAEKKAIDIQDFAILDTIYTEYIHLSTYYGKLAPSIYLQKRKRNNEKLKNIRLLDDALATIIYDFNKSQNYGKAKNSTNTILTKTINFLNSKKEFKDNLLFKNKLFNAISQLLLSKKDYVSLELYAISTYNDFLKKNYFSKVNHELKLQILRYICNTLFINKKYGLAINYITIFKTAINEFKGMLYNKNIFFYYNALANNYSVLDPEKAVVVLNEAKNIPAIIHHPSHLIYIYLNLAGANFDLKHYKVALKNILNLYKHPSYETLDNGLKIQIIIMEIIVRLEINHLDVALRLLNATINNRLYKKILATPEYKNDIDFLLLIKKLVDKFEFKTTKQSTELVANFCSQKYKYKSQNFIDYNKWLYEKINIYN